jgi:HEPN domain-containing protein
MKTLKAGCILDSHELSHIPSIDLVKVIKQRIARDLAERLVNEIEFTEKARFLPFGGNGKEIQAEITIISKEARQAIQTMKEVI